MIRKSTVFYTASSHAVSPNLSIGMSVCLSQLSISHFPLPLSLSLLHSLNFPGAFHGINSSRGRDWATREVGPKLPPDTETSPWLFHSSACVMNWGPTATAKAHDVGMLAKRVSGALDSHLFKCLPFHLLVLVLWSLPFLRPLPFLLFLPHYTFAYLSFR